METPEEESRRLEDEEYCWKYCPEERREGEDCSLNGGCPLLNKGKHHKWILVKESSNA
jgi:hypothetical protein